MTYRRCLSGACIDHGQRCSICTSSRRLSDARPIQRPLYIHIQEQMCRSQLQGAMTWWSDIGPRLAALDLSSDGRLEAMAEGQCTIRYTVPARWEDATCLASLNPAVAAV
jgi:hypothetical protein